MPHRRCIFPPIAPRLLCVSTGPKFATHHCRKRGHRARQTPSHSKQTGRTYLYHSNYLIMKRLKTARQGIQRERKNYGLYFRNPLNIRQMPPTRSHGCARSQRRQAGFCRFPHFDAGICAAIQLAAHYIGRRGCRTVGQLLDYWAPSCPCEHDLYVACVCGRYGLSPTMPLSLHSPAFAYLLSALARQETGMRLSPLHVEMLLDAMRLEIPLV